MRARLAVLAAAVLGLLPGAAGAGPGDADGALRIRWLGVAGFSIASGDAVLLHDPYLSRPGLLRTLFGWYRPDPEVLGPLLAEGSPAPELAEASLVIVGHSHFDHLGDVAWIAERTGAEVAGSLTTTSIARGYGLPAQRALRLDPGESLTRGPFEVRVVESRHARVLFGRVPFPGEVREPPEAPIHAFSFELGDARGYLVTHRPTGVRIFLLSSAGVHAPALDALRDQVAPVDVLLAATQGRDDQFASALVDGLRPKLVVPHHFDDFFEPLASEDAAAPRDPDDLEAFEEEILAAARAHGVEVEVRVLGLFETLSLP